MKIADLIDEIFIRYNVNNKENKITSGVWIFNFNIILIFLLKFIKN